MALSQAGWAAVGLAVPGVLAFIFAVVAENKKPTDNMAEQVYKNGVTVCNYPSDPTLGLGIVSVILLFIAGSLSMAAMFYPYDQKRVSRSVLWQSISLVVFTVLALLITITAELLLFVAILGQYNHRQNNRHLGKIQACPTGKVGLFGGAGFLALDATLFFLISLMLTMNARSDHLDAHLDGAGDYGEVGTEYAGPLTHRGDRV